MFLLTVPDGKDTAQCCREISKSRQVMFGNIAHLKECETDSYPMTINMTPLWGESVTDTSALCV
jgi:hypothetical protein